MHVNVFGAMYDVVVGVCTGVYTCAWGCMLCSVRTMCVCVRGMGHFCGGVLAPKSFAKP